MRNIKGGEPLCGLLSGQEPSLFLTDLPLTRATALMGKGVGEGAEMVVLKQDMIIGIIRGGFPPCPEPAREILLQ